MLISFLVFQLFNVEFYNEVLFLEGKIHDSLGIEHPRFWIFKNRHFFCRFFIFEIRQKKCRFFSQNKKCRIRQKKCRKKKVWGVLAMLKLMVDSRVKKCVKIIGAW